LIIEIRGVVENLQSVELWCLWHNRVCPWHTG